MTRLARLALLLALVGCSSSPPNDWSRNDAAAGADAAGSVDAGPTTDAAGARGLLTWKENGVPRTATSVVASRFVGASSESLGVQGTDSAAGATLSFLVSRDASPMLAGTHTCGSTSDGGAPATAALSYGNATVPANETCTITLTFSTGSDGQPHVTGTFEATVPSASGTITLTEGTFDLPYLQYGG
jgi:hypothetical protein